MEKKQREDASEIGQEKRKRNKSEHVLDQKGKGIRGNDIMGEGTECMG
jgi:hypothetical protein